MGSRAGSKKPGQAFPLEDSEAPEQTKARVSEDGPRLTASEADKRSPGQARPEVNSNEPICAEVLKKGRESIWTRSGTTGGNSIRAKP